MSDQNWWEGGGLHVLNWEKANQNNVATEKRSQFFFLNIFQKISKFHFFFNLRGRSEISWIERKTNFQIFPIFIFQDIVILVSFFVTSSPQLSMITWKINNRRIFSLSIWFQLLRFKIDSPGCIVKHSTLSPWSFVKKNPNQFSEVLAVLGTMWVKLKTPLKPLDHQITML